MSDKSWFSMSTTTNWSKWLAASVNTGREPDESPGVGIARMLQAENTRTTRRRDAISVGGGCGRTENRIEGTNVGTAPYLSGRYMPTRTRLSQVVAGMRNSVAGIGNPCLRIPNRHDIEVIEMRRRIVLFLFFLILFVREPLLPTVTTVDQEEADPQETEGHRRNVPGNRLEDTGEHDARRLNTEVRLRRRLMSRVVDRSHLGLVCPVRHLAHDARVQAHGLERSAIDAQLVLRDARRGVGSGPRDRDRGVRDATNRGGGTEDRVGQVDSDLARPHRLDVACAVQRLVGDRVTAFGEGERLAIGRPGSAVDAVRDGDRGAARTRRPERHRPRKCTSRWRPSSL